MRSPCLRSHRAPALFRQIYFKIAPV
jgi:hypothetical protein